MSISSIYVCHRLGVIEEEREEDERKLSVAIAAAERMNVLVRKTEKVNYQAKFKIYSLKNSYIFKIVFLMLHLTFYQFI